MGLFTYYVSKEAGGGKDTSEISDKNNIKSSVKNRVLLILKESLLSEEASGY